LPQHVDIRETSYLHFECATGPSHSSFIGRPSQNTTNL
jgi:hypothetical protein